MSPSSGSRLRCGVLRAPSFITIIVVHSLALASPAPALELNQTGRWTPPKPLTGIPVHMALLPGYGPYYATVMWWYGLGEHESTYGGLLGWRPGEYNCGTYPDTSLLAPFALPLPGAAGVFCSSESHMADGRLFLAGGTQPGTENGTRHAYIFDPKTISWTPVDSMSLRRWYPTSTTLADGRQLVTSGSLYQHIHFFGGLRNTEGVPRDQGLFRYGVGANGIVDPAMYTGSGTEWPKAREGHAWVTIGLTTHMFGGRDSSNLFFNEYWQLTRGDNPLASEYDYKWSKKPPHASDPPARWDHSAVATPDTFATMIVFGGIKKNTLQEDVVVDEVWRLKWVSAGSNSGWKWFSVPTSGSVTPGPRCGHAALWRLEGRKMLVFGGRSSTTGGPADASSTLWSLNFESDYSAATWENLGASGPSPRFHSGIGYDYSRRPDGAYVFGGEGAGGQKVNDLWRLNVGALTWTNLTDSIAGTRPSARSRHTATVNQHLLYVFGGSGSDGTVYVAHLDSAHAGELKTWTTFTSHSPALSGHAAFLHPLAIFARQQEIFDPTSQQWSLLSSAPRFQNWYPQMFVWKPDTLFDAGPDLPTYKFGVSPASWVQYPSSSSGFLGGSAVMYRPGRVMKCGSRDIEGAGGAPAVGTTKRINLDAGTEAVWQASANAMLPRVNHNLVLLPNGKVLVVGGTHTLPGDTLQAQKRPEIWDPDNSGGIGAWFGKDTLAAQLRTRDYHSTALLLPDGRVLSSGGNYDPYTRHEAEIFCPPYLFKSDGSLAARPTISGAPAGLTWGRPFTLCSPNTGTTSRVSLIRPAATTHGFDQNQRYVQLTYTVASNPARLLVNPPASPDSAPPGDYLLFVTGSADGSDVPSIARWVRLGTAAGGDSCDPVAPAAVGDLSGCYYAYGPNAGKIDLTWTAPADDSTLAASGRAKFYDFRYSYQPINTEAQFNGATQVSPAPPAPATVGTLEQHLVGSFSPNLTVYFRMKAIDDRGGWTNASSMSNQAVVNTSPLYDCLGGEGFFGGSGGGGGGGFRAGRVAAATSAQPVADGALVENSLLEGARSGEMATDTHRLAAAPRITGGAYVVRIRAAGASVAVLDAARLLVVDHAPGVSAYALSSGIAPGSRVAADRATAGDGTELTSALDGSGELAFAAGDVLTVELGTDAAVAAESSRVLVLEARRLGGLSTERLGILIQVPDGAGGWQPLRTAYPRLGFDEIAVEVGDANAVRLVFERSCGVRFVGRLERPLEAPVLHWSELVAATSNRSGELADVLATADTAASTVAGGDTLTLGFSVPPQADGTVRDYFLEVRATPASAKAAPPSSTAAARHLPTRFELHQNQPNPFRDRTAIRFELPIGAVVRLEVFDLKGRRLRLLANRYFAPGHHSVEWDNRAAAGRSVGPGVYFYRIEAGPFRERRQMVLLP